MGVSLPTLLTLIAFSLVLHAPAGMAQSDAGGGYRFQPPRPPPLDGADFDDADEDTMELGDDGFRPPPPPGTPAMPPGGMPGGAPPQNGVPPDFNAGGGGVPGGGYSTVAPGKFRFQIVEGEFWRKGKKRGRGREMRVTGPADKSSRQ